MAQFHPEVLREDEVDELWTQVTENRSPEQGTVRDPSEGADIVESVHGGAIVRDVYPWPRPLVAESARFAVDRQQTGGRFITGLN
jgi:hypothetical protein